MLPSDAMQHRECGFASQGSSVGQLEKEICETAAKLLPEVP